MTVTIGRRGVLGVGIETKSGETASTTTFIPYLSCDLIERHTPIGDVSAKGVRDEQGSNSVEGKKWGEGGIEVILDPTTCPIWFGLALGSVSSTTVGAIYGSIHTISRKAENEPLTATIYRDRVVDEVKFPFSVVNSLELNFADDVAKLSMDVLSRHPIDESDSPGFVDLELITFKHAYVELTLSDGTTTSELKIRELTLSINNNAEAIYAPNSNDADRIVSKQFGVSGSMKVLFESETQKDAFAGLDKQAVSIVFQASSTGKITITIPQFRVDSWDQTNPNDDLSEEEISFVAEYDGTESISVVVDNDVGYYY